MAHLGSPEKAATLSPNLDTIPGKSLIKRTVSEFKLSAAVMGIDMSVDFSDLILHESGKIEGIGVEERNDLEHGSIKVSDLPQSVQEQRVIGDPNRVASILRHFLSNGIMFTPQGGKQRLYTVKECRGSL